ncbi:MAG: polysaccharide biosynthesis tyrosine autokinase [Proteobacteria bacterium]|nr:polysaccharide biosynthesis tyrosine autokinase [Pseudomonadota bacterium]
MDGYAVRAKDVAKVPVTLKVIGEAPAGAEFNGKIGAGEAAAVVDTAATINNPEVRRIVQGLRNEVAVARARAASLMRELDKLKKEVGGLNTQEIKLRALQREASASLSLLENLLARSKETTSQQDFQQADANILSYAAVPQIPSYPNKGLMFAIATIMGGFLGVLLAFVFEQLDQGFRSTEQVERLLGVSSLGLAPRLKGLASLGKSPNSYVLDKPASAFAEAIRKLHTGLLLSGGEKQPKSILFASSLPGEGKTTIVISLARMLSSIGQKVLVIDGDLRKPTLHRAFGVSGTPGLVDCLNDLATLEAAVQVDEKSGAHLLPAGTQAVHPPNLLGSQAMERLLFALSKNYDLVIVDSAPVIAVSDTLVLARMVDKVVFMVQWRDTRRETAANGLRQIRNAGGDVAGVLLSLVDVKEHAQYGFGDSGTYTGKTKKYYAG